MNDKSESELPELSPAVVAQYAAALKLIQDQLQILWTIFGIFLLAETVLLGGVARIYQQGPTGLVLGGAVCGLLLVIPWFANFEYTRYFYLLRIRQAQEHEPKVAVHLTEGHELAHGKSVRDLHIPRFFRIMRPQHAGWFLMALFSLSFAAMALAKIYRSCAG